MTLKGQLREGREGRTPPPRLPTQLQTWDAEVGPTPPWAGWESHLDAATSLFSANVPLSLQPKSLASPSLPESRVLNPYAKRLCAQCGGEQRALRSDARALLFSYDMDKDSILPSLTSSSMRGTVTSTLHRTRNNLVLKRLIYFILSWPVVSQSSGLSQGPCQHGDTEDPSGARSPDSPCAQRG